MIAKLKTLYWFAIRPTFYWHGLELFLRKFRVNYDSPDHVYKATKWAKHNTVSVEKALHTVGLIEEGVDIPQIDKQLIDEANLLAQKSQVKMGGAGDMELIYAATHLSKANIVIETGVAYGWSSLSLLKSLDQWGTGSLISIDMPFWGTKYENQIGCVIPKKLLSRWRLIRLPDRDALPKILKSTKPFDLCHYDSDKSYDGKIWALPRIWNRINDHGLIICDDISDNLAFKDFCENFSLNPIIVKTYDLHVEKHVGIIMK